MSDRLRYTIRATALVPLAIAMAVAALALALDLSVTALEAIAVLLATGVAFSVDDPAHETLAASPAGFRSRRVSRIRVVLVPVGVVLVVAWSLYASTDGSKSVGEMAALATMAAGLLGLSVGVAGIAGRREGRGGVFAGPVVLALLLASGIFAERWRPLPLGDVPGGFPAIIQRWAAAALVGTGMFLWSSRDPMRRRAPGRS